MSTTIYSGQITVPVPGSNQGLYRQPAMHLKYCSVTTRLPQRTVQSTCNTV